MKKSILVITLICILSLISMIINLGQQLTRAQSNVMFLESALGMKKSQVEYLEVENRKIKEENEELKKQEFVELYQNDYENRQFILKTSAYTAGLESTGKTVSDPLYGITSRGTYVRKMRSIATDWSIFPPNTILYIPQLKDINKNDDGIRIVDDTGSAIKGYKADLYIPNLKEALKFGNKQLYIEVLKWGDDKNGKN